jgi:hypothetical protein
MNRSNLRRFLLPALFLGIAIAAPASFGAKDNTTDVQAVMLDHNEFPCQNCLFGVADYYFCFDASSKILIGYDKVRTQTRRKVPTDLMERGKTVPLRFDDKYIWVKQANGKELRLTQDYTKKIFLSSDRCQRAVK